MKAKCVLTKGNDVQVQGQNVFFTELLFDFQGQQHFLELADKTHLLVTGDIFDQLHGDGAGAGVDGALVADQLPGGVDQRDQVNAAMFKKAFVFGIKQGADKQRWDFIISDGNQSLAKLLNKLIVCRIDA